MKKKILNFVLAFCLFIPCMIGLVACKTGGNPAGTYYVSSVTMNGETMDIDMYSDLKETPEEDLALEDQMGLAMFGLFFEQTLTINADGTMTLSITGDDSQTQTGTWTLDGNTLSLTSDGQSMTATYSNGTITLAEGEGAEAVTIVYTKE